MSNFGLLGVYRHFERTHSEMPKAVVYPQLFSRQFIQTETIPVHYTSNSFPYQLLSQNLVSLLRRCVSTKQVQQVQTQMLVNSVYRPNFLLPKIIDFKDFRYASLVFSYLNEPNEYSFNVMIRGLTTTWHEYSLTLDFYQQMKFLGVERNKFTFPFVFMACANLLKIDHGTTTHSDVVKLGLDNDNHISHSMITMYSRFSQSRNARKVFDEITAKDSVSWNSLISGYTKMGYAKEAVEMFENMRDAGVLPDEMTLVSVLGACGDLGNLSLGVWVERFVSENKMELNSYLGSALIGMYSRCGQLASARSVFDSMTKKDTVTWNSMITGYAQNGMADEAIRLFNVVREEYGIVNKITLTGVLSACASIGALELGKWIDSYASQRGMHRDIFVATALVDMYAKCGSLGNALRVFNDMPKKNEASWNAMISALAFHGRAKEALSLFEEMLKEGGTQPNEITFVGVLSACVHTGLVSEGRRFFKLFSTSFGLEPKIEHYSCMVDLLARAGHLYEAWDFVEKMPEKPDEVILGALLAACQKQKNVDISERVMQLLLDIEPSNSGNYVISSKIFAKLNRHEDAARMRILMRDRGVSKTPGCSWIDIDNQFHEFHSGDDLRQKSIGIYIVLDLLYEELEREGYVPKLGD